MTAACAGVMLCLALDPIQAAAESGSVLQSAGVTAILQTKLSTEEYIERAIQAQGAAWGYTNIGVADVENGNLNVREEPSVDSKLVGKMPKNSCPR